MKGSLGAGLRGRRHWGDRVGVVIVMLVWRRRRKERHITGEAASMDVFNLFNFPLDVGFLLLHHSAGGHARHVTLHVQRITTLKFVCLVGCQLHLLRTSGGRQRAC